MTGSIRSVVRFSLTVLSFSILIAPQLLSQTVMQRDAGIVSILQSVSPDTLMVRVRELCGEFTVQVKGTPTLIANRLDGFETQNNELAGDYLEEKLGVYGLDVRSERFQDRGRNVIAVQPGQSHPDIKYIICAHYDAARFEYPAADDNASGTAAVLEAARLLSGYEFDFSIEYCLWDAEERGLVGSRYYAQTARQRGDSILGVLNLDMIAYDSDNDMTATLEYNTDDGLELVWMMQSINTSYDVGLDLVVRKRSSTPSDNYSFTQAGYPSFLFIEDWADFNANYHGTKDTPDNLNVPYFTAITRVALGGLAQLAGLTTHLAADEPPLAGRGSVLHAPWPHPFRDHASIAFTIAEPGPLRVELYDIMGRRIALLADGTYNAGTHTAFLNAAALPGGAYLLRMHHGGTVTHRRIIRSE
ncbi:MAG: hypothetical protein C0600_11700 [Ignavibacteria bacterium]|nr:MAG: hypothetical protein C0600_11700 [Ignavibacteria bacterium]